MNIAEAAEPGTPLKVHIKSNTKKEADVPDYNPMDERTAKLVSKQKKHIEKFGKSTLMTPLRPTMDMLKNFDIVMQQ